MSAALVLLTMLAGIFLDAVIAPPPVFASSVLESAPTFDPESISLVLSPDARGTYAPGAVLTTTLTVRNDGTEALTGGHVRLELGKKALVDRAATTEWLTGGSSPSLSPIGSAEVGPIEADAQGTVTVAATGADIGALPPGVYPLHATYASSSAGVARSTVTARSVIIVPRGQRPPVSVIVPITATPKAALLDAGELTALTAPRGTLSVQLDAIAGTAAGIAVDPAIPAAIRTLGTAAPPSAIAWLNRLETLPNESFALQFADADTAAQAAAGLTAPLTVDTLEPFLSARNAPPPSPGTDGAPIPSPTEASEPPVPDVAALTALGADLDGLLWPRGAVSAQDVAALSRFPSSPGSTKATTLILPSTSFTAGAGGGSIGARGTVEDHDVLVTDAGVSATLSRAAGEADPGQRGAALAEAEGLLWFADPSSPVLVGLDRDEDRPGDALAEAVSTSVGGTRSPTLGELLSSAPVTLDLAPTFAADRSSAVPVLLEEEKQIAAFSFILEDPEQLTVRQRIASLRLLAVGTSPDSSSFGIAFAEHREAARRTLDSVGIQPSNPIIISSTVDVPVWLRNDLPYPVHVQLDARASDARLDAEQQIDVTGQAKSTTRVKVPVQTRVASGEMTLILSLTGPTGVPIGSPQLARLTVHAEWESIGLIVLGGIAALLIGAGIVRTVLRRRTSVAIHSTQGINTPGGEGKTNSDE